jgi:SAM-dependent methyltransferase
MRTMPARYAKTRDIAAKYDGTADEHYDLRYKDVQFQKYDMLLAHAERLLGTGATIQLLREVVVDSGCGSGLLVAWLAERQLFGGARFVGIDISRGMLAVARQKALHRPGIDFIQATAELSPLRDGVAAVAFSISTYQNLDKDQQPSYISALRKTLRASNALLLFSVLKKSLNDDDLESLSSRLHDLFTFALVVPDDDRIEDWLLVFAEL